MVKSIATSRRRFVQSLGAGGVVLAGTAITQKKSYAAVGTVQYGMVIDPRKCKGCHACSVVKANSMSHWGPFGPGLNSLKKAITQRSNASSCRGFATNVTKRPA